MRKVWEFLKKRLNLLNPKLIAKPAVLPRPMATYITILVAMMFSIYSIIIISGIAPFDQFISYIILFSLYFFAALAGSLMYRARKKRFHLISQFPFIIACAEFFSHVLSGQKVSAVTGDLHSILFLLSYVYLMVSGFIVFLERVKPQKKQVKLFVIFITFLWILMTILLLFKDAAATRSSGLSLLLMLLAIPFLISLISFIYVLKKGIKKRYLVFFQSAFFSFFLWILYSSVVFGWEFWWSGAKGKVAQLIVYFLLICWAVTLISVVCFIMNRFFFRFWKRKPLYKYTGLQVSKPISIYPEASTYIDVHGKAAWLERFTRGSDGGVVGVTGVRGAGKSALLNKMISLFKNEFFTLHITSPVHSSNRMEFFMMVCREVCARVIKDIESRVFLFSDTASRKAKEGMFTKIRVIALAVVIITAGILASRSFQVKPEVIRSIGERDYWEWRAAKRDTSCFLLGAENFCIKNLHKRINDYLEQESVFNNIVVIPQTGDRYSQVEDLYWDILPVVDDKINLKDIFDVFMKTRIEVGITEFEHFFKQKKPGYVIGKPYELSINVANHLFIDNKLNAEFFNVLHYFIFIRPFVQQILGEGYYRHLGETLLFQQEKTVEAIFRGSNAARLIHLTKSAASLLGIKEGLNGSPKLMSWIIFRAFVTQARNNSKELLLDRRNRARQLRDYLAAYLENLSPYKAVRITRDPRQVDEKKGFLYSSEFWLLCVITLLIIGGGFLRRWINFFVASLFNFKAFGVWMRSKEFINLLSYSESSEKKGTFTLSRALSFSMNKRQTQRELTLSGLTNLFIDYIKEVSQLYNRKMIICIDELDKLDDFEEVKKILREIKGALFVRNTYYFISISRDAALSFQGRLSSGRDIFESTFDDVITLNRLDSRQAWEIIEKRLVKGSEVEDNDLYKKSEQTAKMETNAAALAMYAGGIPREIIRFLREVLLRDNRFDEVKPVDIGVLILKQRLDELIRDVSLIAVPGEKSLELYNLLEEIKAILVTPAGITPNSIKKTTSFIEKCLSIIDPENLYMKVSPSSAEKEKALYEAIREDVKKYVELLVMAEVLSYFKNREPGKPVDGAFQAKIFSCTTALDENPALAKHILYDNREQKSEGPVLEKT